MKNLIITKISCVFCSKDYKFFSGIAKVECEECGDYFITMEAYESCQSLKEYHKYLDDISNVLSSIKYKYDNLICIAVSPVIANDGMPKETTIMTLNSLRQRSYQPVD